MNKNSFKVIAATWVVSLVSLTIHAGSPYSNEVMSLNPVAYWPLQLTTGANAHLAKNLGTLGAMGDAHYDNAFYSIDQANFQIMSLFPGPGPGATSDGDAGAVFNGGTNNNDNAQYLIIPDINSDLDQSGTAFTAEVWVRPGGGDPNDPTGASFASTEWTSIVSKGGGGCQNAVIGDDSYNTYGWSIELAGIYSLGAPVGWYGGDSSLFRFGFDYEPYDSNGPVQLMTNACWVVDFYGGSGGFSPYFNNFPVLEFDVPMYEAEPQWFHLVLTYDGTDASFYTNGVLAATTMQNTPQSMNNMFAPGSAQSLNYQNNWPTSLNGDYEFGEGGYAPDTINPLVIGNINPTESYSNSGYPETNSVGYNCQNFNGIMDELAIYPNSLSSDIVLKHYQDASSPDHSLYTNDVLSATPLIYLRFDEPVYTADPAQDFDGFPEITNYGSMNAPGYLVNVVPGFSGPQLPGLGSDTNSIFCNGMDAAVDVGDGGNLSGSPLDPQGYQPFSIAFWVRGNPADMFSRYQCILGRGDYSWQFDMDQEGGIDFAPGSGPELYSYLNYNDGNWHNVVGVSDGTNDFLYIDGQLIDAETAFGMNYSAVPDLLIGGAPDYSTASGNRFFSGEIAHVAFFSTALVAGQAAALYDTATILNPVIEVGPQSIAVNQDDTAAFTVIASGAPTGYQWYQDGTKLTDVDGQISGSATAILTITSAQATNRGNYTVSVSNSYGSASSSGANLTVYTTVVFTSDISPLSEILFPGGQASFSVAAAGLQPVTYQWYTNNTAVPGAVGQTLGLANVRSSMNVYCVAANSYGPVSSSIATITIVNTTNAYPLAIVADNPVGFWRLSESDNGNGNNGVIAHDYWGGNNGIYTNTILGQTGYDLNEPTETSALFGDFATSNSMAYDIPTNVDFSAPYGNNSQFSIECWVNGSAQTSDAGIVSKGLLYEEQFTLDTGSDYVGPEHSFRFLVEDAFGGWNEVDSTNPPDGQWHHLVGVCDEVDGYVALYIDGFQVAQTTVETGYGVLSVPQGMQIGSSPSFESITNGNQFVGDIADVAVYNYALTAVQIQSHYYSGATVPPQIILQPTNEFVDAGLNVAFVAEVAGPPPVTNQWYNAGTGQPIPGATNTTLVLTNVQSGDNGKSYYMTTANAYGANTSDTATLTVYFGAPQIAVDVENPFSAVTGGMASNSVVAHGSEPLSYHWQLNGVNLTDGAAFMGSDTDALTIEDAVASEAGGYRVIVSNSFGTVTSSVAQLTIIGPTTPVGFNGNGAGWQANGYATIETNVLMLTDGNPAGYEASSFFYLFPQYIGTFTAAFTYQDVGGSVYEGADGITFCIQNDPRGTSALGGTGGSLGVGDFSNITPSAEFEFNLYTGANIGYTFLTNGLTGAGGANGNYTTPGSVVIDSGDPINVSLNYDGNVLVITLLDSVAGTSYTTNLVVGDLTQAVGGNTAYVGFTGGDGAVTSVQTITNFTFLSVPTASIQLAGKTVTISWPSTYSGWGVQETFSLSEPNWVTITNQINLVGALYEVTMPVGATNGFFRLESSK